MNCFIIGQPLKPTIDDLQQHVIPLVATKWHDLGLVLLDPINRDVLDDMEKLHKEAVLKYCIEMFKECLDYRDNSWYQLLEAIRIIRFNDVANNIESLLLQGECTV